MDIFDPSRPNFAPYGFTCVRWQPSTMPRPDRHNEIELNLLPAGWMTYLLGGKAVTLPARQLCAFWAAVPHQVIDYGGMSEYFVATLPLSWALEKKFPARFVQRLLRGEVICDPQTDFAHLDCEWFLRWERDLDRSGEEHRNVVLLELEARLRRMAISLPPVADSAQPSRANIGDRELNKAEQMACFIARRYMEQINVDDVGRSVDLHPNYAMNLFKKTFGTTLNNYLIKNRVFHAQHLLASTDTRVVDVALSSGFASISRFNAAFRQVCDCSPREYRRRNRLRHWHWVELA